MQAMNELAGLSHDIRKIDRKKLPRNIKRTCVIICNTKAHLNSESQKAALRFAKLGKYLECEVYVITNPTVDEFIDVLRHFVTEVQEFLTIFTTSNKLNAKSSSESPSIACADDSVDPALLFDLLNSKSMSSKVFMVMDGINNPNSWDPTQNGASKSGIYLIAPYVDPQATEIVQFDHSQNSFFNMELTKAIKSNPVGTLKEFAGFLNESLSIFGLKVFVASCPAEFRDTDSCLV